MRQSQAVVIAVVVLAAASIFSGELTAQNPNPNGTAPGDYILSADIYPGNTFGSCAFPINISADPGGKIKTITLPKGNTIMIFPGAYATVTNLTDTTKHVTVNVTGSSHESPTSDGGMLTVITGRNLVQDPFAGIALAIGNFSFAFDKDFNLTQPLTSQGGTVTDLCALVK